MFDAGTENKAGLMRQAHRATFFIFPLVAYFYLNYITAVLHIGIVIIYLHRYVQAAVWAAYYSLSCLVFLWLLVALKKWKLYVFIGLTGASFLANHIFYSIVGERINTDVAAWLMDQRGSLGDAYWEFTGRFLLHGLAVAGTMALLLLWRFYFLRSEVSTSAAPPSWKRIRSLGAVIAFSGIHAVCFLARPEQLPSEINFPLMALNNYTMSSEPEPRHVLANPAVRKDLDKIILIVDESMRADYFRKFVIRRLEGLPYIDYGEAAATVNCSSGSNALLRWGLDQNQVGNKDYEPRRGPYIWSYAKQAGYRTVLIDGQAVKGYPQNFLGGKERKLIDEIIQFRTADSGTKNDIKIARTLNARMRTRDREFIYVVMQGVHFPYEAFCPEGCLSRTATREEKYGAAIRYTRDNFFCELTRGVEFGRIFIIYTSDHGVTLDETNVDDHCNISPDWEEFSVPLIVLTGCDDIRSRLLKGAALVQGHASHEQIFPTLLFAMGYPNDVDGISYASPLYERWNKFTILKWPFVPIRGRDKPISLAVFDHFPYRKAGE